MSNCVTSIRAMAAVAFMLAAPLEAFAQNDSGGYILEGARGDVERVLRNVNVGTLTRFETAPSVYVTPDPLELKRLQDQIRQVNEASGVTEVRLQRHAAPAESIFSVDGMRPLTAEEKPAGARIALQGMRVVNVLDLAPGDVVTDAFGRGDGQRVALPLPNGDFQSFEAVDAPRTFGRARFWTGQTTLPDGSYAQAELMELDGVISGRMETVNGDVQFRQLSESTFAVIEPAVRAPPAPDHPASAFDGPNNPGAAAPSVPLLTPTCPAGAELRILFVFTKPAEQGLDSLDQYVFRPLSEFRTALNRSSINSFTVSEEPLTYVSAYSEDADKSPCSNPLYDCSSTQMDKAWNRHLIRLQTRGDIYLDDVFAERARVHADVVVLIVRDAMICGAAPDDVITTPTTRDTAFAVVALGCLGGRATLAHELGHLMGSRHENETSAGGDNFAFAVSNPQTGWATIGARTCYAQSGSFRDLCPRNRYSEDPQRPSPSPAFASPAIVPAGVSVPTQRNEAGTIRRFGPCVARFGD
ncbi:peptidyl-Asp metalloendopeptidase [alpha proteobacterium U9-1i]|nr:peptidyl-Asp metalloendopeptidase [alpha proteobacterium U9-1i]